MSFQVKRYRREAELAVLFPLIASFLDQGDLLNFLSIFRRNDPDRRYIEQSWEGHLKLPMMSSYQVGNVFRRKFRTLSAMSLGALIGMRKLSISHQGNIVVYESTLRAFRACLASNTLRNLKQLALDDYSVGPLSNAGSALWHDLPASLTTLKNLEHLSLQVGDFSAKVSPAIQELLLVSMSQLPKLQDFDFNWKVSATKLPTFLMLKWPALTVLRTQYLLAGGPDLLSKAFSDGHFPSVTKLIIGEHLEGNLYSRLPTDGLKQIKHLRLEGRILRSLLLNFAVAMTDIQQLYGFGGTIHESKFTGVETLDIACLSAPDVMRVFHTADEQSIYCEAFSSNTLRALRNLTAVFRGCNITSLLVSSDCFLNDLDPFPACYPAFYGTPLYQEHRDAHANLKAARFSCLHPLMESLRSLTLLLGQNLYGIAIPGPNDDPTAVEPYQFERDPAAGEIFFGSKRSRCVELLLSMSQSIPHVAAKLQTLCVSTSPLQTLRAEILDIIDPDELEEINFELSELQEQFKKQMHELQDQLECQVEEVGRIAAAAQNYPGSFIWGDPGAARVLEEVVDSSNEAHRGLCELGEKIAEAEAEVSFCTSIQEFNSDPHGTELVTEEDCSKAIGSPCQSSSFAKFRSAISPFTALSRIVVLHDCSSDDGYLDLDALLLLPPRSVKDIVLKFSNGDYSSWRTRAFPFPERLISMPANHGAILRYFPRLKPQPAPPSFFKLTIQPSESERAVFSHSFPHKPYHFVGKARAKASPMACV